MPPANTSRSAETRQKLLDAALRLFAEHGFKGVSVRDISAMAEANVAAISYHFGSKQELYRVLFEAILDADEARFREHMAMLHALVVDARQNPDLLATAIRFYAREKFGYFSSNQRFRWLSVLVARELAFPSEAFDILFRRRVEPYQQVLARMAAVALDLDKDSPEARMRAHALDAQVMGMIFFRPILSRRMDWKEETEEQTTALADMATEILCRGLGIAVRTGDSA